MSGIGRHVVALQELPRLVAKAAPGHTYALDDLRQALFTMVADDALAESALDTLAAARPGLWLDLDRALRPSWYRQGDPALRPMTALRRLTNSLAVALTACSRDGHERERAVRHAVMRTDPRLHPILAIRTTDWAGEVATAADQLLARVLADSPAPALLAITPVAVRLGDRQRGRPILNATSEALRRADDATLAALRGCADVHTRRFAYGVTLDAGRLPEADLVGAALRQADVVSQTMCAEAVDRLDRCDLLEQLLNARSAQVRAIALTGLVRLGHPGHGARFLRDNSSTVRMTAQWAVRRAGGDPAKSYRDSLAARPAAGVRNLIAGLAECGGRDDAELARPYLTDPRPRVRATAVRTLHRLNAPVDFAGMLDDPAPIVVRRVAKALRDKRLPADRLWALLSVRHPRHVRQAAHRLLRAMDTWTRLKSDLILLGDSDESLRRRAGDDLAAWRANEAATIYTTAPEPVRSELNTLIRAAEAELGTQNAHDLRWLIGVYDPGAG